MATYDWRLRPPEDLPLPRCPGGFFCCLLRLRHCVSSLSSSGGGGGGGKEGKAGFLRFGSVDASMFDQGVLRVLIIAK